VCVRVRLEVGVVYSKVWAGMCFTRFKLEP
jgi:hypothetical protein